MKLHEADTRVEEVVVTTYAAIAILTAFLWEWILCIPEEVEILQRKRRLGPIIAYYLSRFSSLGGCIVFLLNHFGIIPYTRSIVATKFGFFWGNTIGTSLLFYFRICAVYHHSRLARVLFTLSLVIVGVSPGLVLFSLYSTCSWNQHRYCYMWSRLALLTNATVCVNDTLVLIGISIQIYKNSTSDRHDVSLSTRWDLLGKGKGLYNISKSLLKSGQLYYGATTGVQIVFTMLTFCGLPYAGLFAFLYLALSSAMACKVFRMVMLCDTEVAPLDTADIEVGFRAVTVHSRGA